MKHRKGQVMLLTVLIISGAVLGATTIAGLLMVHQIRQTTNVIDSLQAVYAADTGLEWKLYQSFIDSGQLPPNLDRADFIAEETSTGGQLEYRAVGCAGAELENPSPGRCPRRLNRSLQLRFLLVE